MELPAPAEGKKRVFRVADTAAPMGGDEGRLSLVQHDGCVLHILFRRDDVNNQQEYDDNSEDSD